MLRIILIMLCLAACSSKEAIEVQLDVVVGSASSDAIETNLGYQVEILVARAAIKNLEFTIEGEEHETTAMGALWELLVPSAYAHPGHGAGGEVTGELRGEFILDWLEDGQLLGQAQLIAGQYSGVNFSFHKAGADDGLVEGDPLIGHNFYLELGVRKGEESWQVRATIDLDDDAEVVGVPFSSEVEGNSEERISLQLLGVAPFDEDTLFDNIDFAALEEGEDGVVFIEPGQSTHNQMRRLLGAHSFYVANTLGM